MSHIRITHHKITIAHIQLPSRRSRPDADLPAVGDEHEREDREGRLVLAAGVERLDVHEVVTDRQGEQVAVDDVGVAVGVGQQPVADVVVGAQLVGDQACSLWSF